VVDKKGAPWIGEISTHSPGGQKDQNRFGANFSDQANGGGGGSAGPWFERGVSEIQKGGGAMEIFGLSPAAHRLMKKELKGKSWGSLSVTVQPRKEIPGNGCPSNLGIARTQKETPLVDWGCRGLQSSPKVAPLPMAQQGKKR